jgi:hypothetical protein
MEILNGFPYFIFLFTHFWKYIRANEQHQYYVMYDSFHKPLRFHSFIKFGFFSIRNFLEHLLNKPLMMRKRFALNADRFWLLIDSKLTFNVMFAIAVINT